MIEVEAVSQPGKTAPRLVKDLLRYDPGHPNPKYNTLTDFPPHFEEGSPPAPQRKDRCRHRWMNKDHQCVVPLIDSRPSKSSTYRVASICWECRCHLELMVEYRGAWTKNWNPCPNTEFFLHHLRLIPEKSKPRPTGGPLLDRERWDDIHVFKCSSQCCSATVTVNISSPKLSREHVSILTDQTLISQRTKAAIDRDPERFKDFQFPTPTTVLSNLRTYITDAMVAEKTREVASWNKQFVTCFGDQCRSLLEWIGFTHNPEVEKWALPKVGKSPVAPGQDLAWNRLDDIEKELQVLLSQLPIPPPIKNPPIPSQKELERALGCFDYPKVISARRATDQTADEDDEHPYYASLGACVDFADDLIVFAYDRQKHCDVINSPYYLECLQGLAAGRKSTDLEMKAALVESTGEVSSGNVKNAFRYFGLNPKAEDLTDEHIIGVFQSRLADAPKQESEMREQLRIIGQARQSNHLMDVASDIITTYEHALSWLGVEATAADDFIPTLYALKVDESESNKAIARKCVDIIATTRGSTALKRWLATGQMQETDMDIGQAYNRLGIEDRTLDDETILTTYELRIQDDPGQKDDLRKALKAIAKSKESKRIEEFLGIFSQSDNVTFNWPVGLDNIGNTCYLNSLLQYYFTLKPLRKLILEFDEFKMEITPESMAVKQVGSRKVSEREVRRAQDFVREFQKLFETMISASSSSILPTEEFAWLTLTSSNNEEAIRRASIKEPGNPSLGELDGHPVLGPLGPPPQSEDKKVIEIEDDAPAEKVELDIKSDTASDTTLIDTSTAPPPYESNELMVVNPDEMEESQELQFENMGVDDFKADYTVRDHETNNSSSTSEEPLHVENTKSEDVIMLEATEKPVSNTQPDRPPPIPPRPKTDEQSTEKKRDRKYEVELGAQQDVTEVIANVLFQLSCAIRAREFDTEGEQVDEIKDLFYGTIRSYTRSAGNTRTKEQYFADIKVDVAGGPRDIYSALDGAFDLQDVHIGNDTGQQFSTIATLPPVLQIQVQRVQFDSVKRSSYKSTAHLELKERIYLDRYMDNTDEQDLMRRKIESWRWKKELRELEAQKTELLKEDPETGLNPIQAIESSKEYLDQIFGEFEAEERVDVEALQKDYENKCNMLKAQLKDLDFEMKELKEQISKQFDGLESLPYRLHSVFMHRGSVNFGHYWIYIYDFDQRIWRKYNDAYVTEVKDTKEIFDAGDDRNPPTPYFLVYVKEEDKGKLVEAVCRKVPSTQSEDVPMVDTEAEDPNRDEAPVDPFADPVYTSEGGAQHPGVTW